MDNLKEQYNQIILNRKGIIVRINELEENEAVKEYLDLCKQSDQLLREQKQLYTQVKVEEYSSCNHIWVNTLHEYDSCEGRSYNYYGCIKCGLDRRVLHLMENYHDQDWLTKEQRIMYNFLTNNQSDFGIKTNLLCDLDLAKAIYSKIKQAHPNIDDETIVKYLKVALHNIRDTKVSDERKVNRAIRLALKPSFNKWKASDVNRF